jgi:hypothetical protein
MISASFIIVNLLSIFRRTAKQGLKKIDCMIDVGKRGKYNEKPKSAQAAEWGWWVVGSG